MPSVLLPDTSRTTSPPLHAPARDAVLPPLRVLHLWHLLSLDAPTVATLWTAFIAHAAAVALPPATLPAMFLTVWLLYAADRLLDARLLHTGRGSTATWRSKHPDPSLTAALGLEPRHLFHRTHRSAFLLTLTLVAGTIALLIPHLAPATLPLNLLLGALLLAYFLLIHAPHGTIRLPKEIAVGLFFAAAVFLPSVAVQPTLRPTLLPIACIFALLCSLNCICIYAWEHPFPASLHQPHPLTRLGVAHITAALLLCLASALCLAALHSLPQLFLAITLSATLLLLLHLRRRQLSSLTLRALADLALTTPLLFLLHR